MNTYPRPLPPHPGEQIGEIWFEPPPEMPQVLVKYLFTSEKLSVQFHPSDANALPGEAGKEECWLVLDAEPDARLAIGFRRKVFAKEIETAALGLRLIQSQNASAVTRATPDRKLAASLS